MAVQAAKWEAEAKAEGLMAEVAAAEAATRTAEAHIATLEGEMGTLRAQLAESQQQLASAREAAGQQAQHQSLLQQRQRDLEEAQQQQRQAAAQLQRLQQQHEQASAALQQHHDAAAASLQQQLSQAAAQLEQHQEQAARDGAAAGQLVAFQQELSTKEQARQLAERQAQHLLHRLQEAEGALSESQAAAAVAQQRLQQEVASAKVSVDSGQRLARGSGPLCNQCSGIACLQAHGLSVAAVAVTQEKLQQGIGGAHTELGRC